jgi:mannose-6-phosphate isomerase-like protein (cupin superfamily)
MDMDESAARGKAIHRRAKRDYRWEGVERLPYKEDGRGLFKSVSRQILFSDPDLAGELRYFEVEPGGYSSLERHEHMHGVLILRGRGTCLVGSEVRSVGRHDLVTVPAWTWHQFRAAGDQPLGFLCMVDAARDKPHLPTEAELKELEAHPKVAAFLFGR